jgi:hypothetical protein
MDCAVLARIDILMQLGMGKPMPGTLAGKKITHKDPFEPPDPKAEEEQEPTFWVGQTATEWLATPVVDAAWRDAYLDAHGADVFGAE